MGTRSGVCIPACATTDPLQGAELGTQLKPVGNSQMAPNLSGLAPLDGNKGNRVGGVGIVHENDLYCSFVHVSPSVGMVNNPAVVPAVRGEFGWSTGWAVSVAGAAGTSLRGQGSL